MADDYTNAGKQTEKQKVQEITQKLEEGIKDVFESEKYKEYLTTMSKFHHYSFNNTMLIAMQKPDATLVAGYQAWQKNFDRHVKRGEKGIRILAPAPYKVKEEQEKTDPVTGELVLDKNGMPVIEEVEIKIPAFRVVPVFDVSQTEGKELPDIGVSELSGSVEDYEDFMQALTEISPVPIGYEQIDGDAKGYFDTEEHRIALQEGMSQSQTVKTAVHEVVHAKLHDRELNSDLEESIPKDRNTKEVEAESVAYTVCQHFGIDTSDYSFGYIAGWSSGKDMKELKSSLDTIRKTASELITGISERLQELKRDRGQEQDKENLLLIENSDLTKYSLLRVSGMDVEQIAEALSVMSEDDKLSIAAYLESRGAWTAEIGNEDTKEFGVYHLDVRYNTDTSEIKTFSDKHTIEQELEQNPAGKEGENMNLDQVSYYVIADISTWADNSQNRSKLERYDSLSDAMEQFGKYRADVTDESEDRAKTTLGASVNGIEFDVAYAIKSENVLSLDFTHSQTAQESSHFMEALQTLCAELPVDKVRVHRTMTPEEKKEFVKQRFHNQLKRSGIEDDSFYMTRFDMLYEQGKMNDLMTTANQQQLVEDVPYTEWDNPYFQMDEPEQEKNAVAETEKVPEKTITWTVAECGEFHELGELHENVETVEQAIDLYNKIPPERMHGIPSIGIRMHTEGTEEYEDVQMDLFSGGVADLEMLEYVPDITDDPKAVAMIQELIDKLPDIEVRGSLEKWQAGFLAAEIDQLSYDYDTYQYKDTVEDREAQVANITEDIRSGNVGYLNDFLNAIIAEEVREGITDIFGQGTEISDSEAVQTARKAKELLDKLAEYKPLAKIEELEEQNYNMIDNVLNNGAEKKEDEKAKTRVSVKEKLAEKKAVIEKRDKAEKNCPGKDTEKKAHREM